MRTHEQGSEQIILAKELALFAAIDILIDFQETRSANVISPTLSEPGSSSLAQEEAYLSQPEASQASESVILSAEIVRGGTPVSLNVIVEPEKYQEDFVEHERTERKKSHRQGVRAKRGDKEMQREKFKNGDQTMTSTILIQNTSPVTSNTPRNEAIALSPEDLACKLGLGSFEDVITCPATKIQDRKTQKGRRCTNHAGVAKRTKALEILTDLSRLELKSNDSLLINTLERLALALICRDYHKDQAASIAAVWASHLIDPSDAHVGNSDNEVATGAPSLLVFSPTISRDARHLYSNTLQYFVRYSQIRPKFRETHVALKALTERELTKKDVSANGYIYIYRSNGVFGRIKIGRTMKDVEKRRVEWVRQCGHDIVVEYPKGDQIQTLPHPQRLEALVHAELRNHRRVEVKCKKCGRRHQEWFETALPDALRAVTKWSEWMRQKPYAISHDGQRDRGSLKEESILELPLMLVPEPVQQQQLTPPRSFRSRSLSPSTSRRSSSPGNHRPRLSGHRRSDSDNLASGETRSFSFSKEFLKSTRKDNTHEP